MKPHPNNFCGGNFQDWLEVMLLPECNGRCSWCIEKDGFHPSHRASWEEITEAALDTGKQNILLLGGEPTLYKDLGKVIEVLADYGRKVYLTTNGSKLTNRYYPNVLTRLTGINISFHGNYWENLAITGISLPDSDLKRVIDTLHDMGISVRLNCNVQKAGVSTQKEARWYLWSAIDKGVDSVRFAELKGDDENFVDLRDILPTRKILTGDPFLHGCNRDVILEGMPVNLRQMCGLQTNQKPCPIDPEQYPKQVLYYDGKIYNGWQSSHTEDSMKDLELVKLLQKVADGKVSPIDAAIKMKEDHKTESFGKRKDTHEPASSGGCQY